MKFLYDVFILLYAIFSIPKFIKKKKANKRYALTLREILGLEFPQLSPEVTKIWIHAVSVGEVKVASTLLPHILNTFPKVQFIVTCATKTGVERAKTSFPTGTICAILPLDFSFIMKRILKRIRPNYLLFSESDFWLHFIHEAKRIGTKIFLINGKISERSFRRYKIFPSFCRALFQPFDGIFVQNEEYARRFEQLLKKSPCIVTGNMKYDVEMPATLLKKQQQKAVTFGSTHAEEEDQILKIIASLHKKYPTQKIYIAPRHPERFGIVKEKLKKMNLIFSTFIEKKETPIILIDVMGQLVPKYAESLLSIVGGSFDEALQGHDIFEPIVAGSIPLFGPYMNAQKEMVELVLRHDVGKQVSIDLLENAIEAFLQNRAATSSCIDRGLKLLIKLQGSSRKTWEGILENNKIVKRLESK